MPKEVWIKETVEYYVEGNKIHFKGKSQLACWLAEHNSRARMKEILKSGKPGTIQVKWVK